jgi:hypothetical protein
MPHLRSLTITDIDPLCYPDDIAMALFASPKLDTVNLHWSPRMRDAGEPSVHLYSYFRHNISAKKKLKLKQIGFYNLFALTSPEIDGIIEFSDIQSLTMLNSFGLDDQDGHHQPSLAAFLDSSWARPPGNLIGLKSIRHDKMSKKFTNHLSDLYGLERIYLVNARHIPPSNGHSAPSDTSPITASTPSSNLSSETTPSTRTAASNATRDLCLDIIISNHGPTLKHLILPDRWLLPDKLVGRLFRACPNITQLALALEFKDGLWGLRMLLPFLKKIRAVRLLVPNSVQEYAKKFECMIGTEDGEQEEHIGRELTGDEFPNLKYVGMGWEVWEIGGTYEKVVVNEDGEEEVVVSRRVRRVGRETVKDVEIWKMDSLDVI